MDDGKGNFKVVNAISDDDLRRRMEQLESKYPNHGGWFRVGEIVELKGSTFRVKSVKPGELRLKLLSKKKVAAINAQIRSSEKTS